MSFLFMPCLIVYDVVPPKMHAFKYFMLKTIDCCMSKKPCPIFIKNVQFKNGQDLGIHCVHVDVLVRGRIDFQG